MHIFQVQQEHRTRMQLNIKILQILGLLHKKQIKYIKICFVTFEKVKTRNTNTKKSNVFLWHFQKVKMILKCVRFVYQIITSIQEKMFDLIDQ